MWRPDGPPREDGSIDIPLAFPSDGRYGQLEFAVFALDKTTAVKVMKVETVYGIQEHLKEKASQLLYAQGKLAEWNKDPAAASAYFQQLAEINPEFKDILLVLAAGSLAQKDIPKAVDLLDQFEKLNDHNAVALARLETFYRTFNPLRADQVRDKRIRLTSRGKDPAVNFSETLELLRSNLDPAPWRPGESVPGTLIWKCNKPIDTDWAVFVHVVKDSQLAFTSDHFIQEGLAPLNSRKPGDVIEDRFTIQVPKTALPGKYDLVIGLWDPLYTKDRLKITAPGNLNGQNSFVVTQITISGDRKLRQE
jgi:tetratricopeptide (TPR) repeat protein